MTLQARSLGQKERAKGFGRKKRAKCYDQKRMKKRFVQQLYARCLERDVDQLASDMTALKIDSPHDAPVSWTSLFKLSMVVAVERQIAVSLGRDPLPSIKQLVTTRLIEVKEARASYLNNCDDKAPLWEFDGKFKKIVDQILEELVEDAKFQLAQMNQKFKPSFCLANVALPSTMRHCKLMEIPHRFEMGTETLT